MISIIYIIINIFLNLFLSYFFYSLLQKSYYSLKRVCFRLSDQIQYYFPLFLISILSLFTFILPLFSPFLLPLNLLSYIFILIFLPKVKGKFTARFIRIFIVNNLFFISFNIIFYLLLPKFLFLSQIFGFFNFLISFYIIKPFDYYKRNKTYKKTKNKLNYCNKLKIIGITGSFGKTTTKNFLISLIHPHRYLSPSGNINTPLGIANYIINNVSIFDRILILELGIDEINGMNEFKKYLNLDIAIITSIGEQHLRTFKTVENIKSAKAKITNLLKNDGKLFYFKNEIDDAYLKENIIKNAILPSDYKILFKEKNMVVIRDNKTMINVPFTDKNLVKDAFMAYKVSLELFNSSINALNLSKLSPSPRRKAIYSKDNLTIIDDSYNLNLKGLSSSIKNALKENKPLTIFTGGIFETGKNIRLLFYFYNLINVADKIIYCQKLLPIEKRIIEEIPGLKNKILYQKNIIYPNNGTLLILTSGDNSSYK